MTGTGCSCRLEQRERLLLKKHNQIFVSLLFISDLLFVALAWMIAYLVRFETGLLEVTKDVPSWGQHLPLLVLILLVYGAVFHLVGLYRPKRLSSVPKEVVEIVKALTISLLIFVFLTYFFREYRYSRLTIVSFWVLSIVLVSLSRGFARYFLRSLRRKGYNQRYAIIVGEGALGQTFLQSLRSHGELGLKVVGFVNDARERVGKLVSGVKVVGTYEDLPELLRSTKTDQIYIALPFHEHEKIRHVLATLKNEIVDIKVVSDLYDFIRLRGGVDELDGLPIINIQDSPLHGWGKVSKRVLDMALSVGALTLFAPVMGLIALLIKLTSPGPIFYKQKRMGFDGTIFEMLKFRSMVDGAEKQTGSVWAQPNDSRRTPIGKILRKASLDELPQLINVLRGEMSLIGPRPERPELIDQFKHRIPKYMLRHKVKAGITGWAQVNGWRGNTSLEKRIEYDLYYIQHWSIGFDVKILFLTLWKGFFNKYAY